jgi:hypothetical protein
MPIVMEISGDLPSEKKKDCQQGWIELTSLRVLILSYNPRPQPLDHNHGYLAGEHKKIKNIKPSSRREDVSGMKECKKPAWKKMFRHHQRTFSSQN